MKKNGRIIPWDKKTDCHSERRCSRGFKRQVTCLRNRKGLQAFACAQRESQTFPQRYRLRFITPFFDCPPEIRKVIYTTNAIESINTSLRKITKTRSSFPTDEAVSKLFYLALNNISKK